jgi:uncharacterized membrane protein YdjX (TVP38/TMEM64 family)
MTLIGIGLFVLIFAMLAPASRKLMENSITGASDWIVKYAPFSYLVLVIIVIVPIVAAFKVMTPPVPPEPENPLAKYKAEDVMED